MTCVSLLAFLLFWTQLPIGDSGSSIKNDDRGDGNQVDEKFNMVLQTLSRMRRSSNYSENEKGDQERIDRILGIMSRHYDIPWEDNTKQAGTRRSMPKYDDRWIPVSSVKDDTPAVMPNENAEKESDNQEQDDTSKLEIEEDKDNEGEAKNDTDEGNYDGNYLDEPENSEDDDSGNSDDDDSGDNDEDDSGNSDDDDSGNSDDDDSGNSDDDDSGNSDDDDSGISDDDDSSDKQNNTKGFNDSSKGDDDENSEGYNDLQSGTNDSLSKDNGQGYNYEGFKMMNDTDIKENDSDNSPEYNNNSNIIRNNDSKGYDDAYTGYANETDNLGFGNDSYGNDSQSDGYHNSRGYDDDFLGNYNNTRNDGNGDSNIKVLTYESENPGSKFFIYNGQESEFNESDSQGYDNGTDLGNYNESSSDLNGRELDDDFQSQGNYNDSNSRNENVVNDSESNVSDNKTDMENSDESNNQHGYDNDSVNQGNFNDSEALVTGQVYLNDSESQGKYNDSDPIINEHGYVNGTDSQGNYDGNNFLKENEYSYYPGNASESYEDNSNFNKEGYVKRSLGDSNDLGNGDGYTNEDGNYDNDTINNGHDEGNIKVFSYDSESPGSKFFIYNGNDNNVNDSESNANDNKTDMENYDESNSRRGYDDNFERQGNYNDSEAIVTGDVYYHNDSDSESRVDNSGVDGVDHVKGSLGNGYDSEKGNDDNGFNYGLGNEESDEKDKFDDYRYMYDDDNGYGYDDDGDNDGGDDEKSRDGNKREKRDLKSKQYPISLPLKRQQSDNITTSDYNDTVILVEGVYYVFSHSDAFYDGADNANKSDDAGNYDFGNYDVGNNSSDIGNEAVNETSETEDEEWWYDLTFRKVKNRVKRHPADGDGHDDFYDDYDEYDDGNDDGSGLITESGDGENDLEGENKITFDDFTLRKVKKRVKRHPADGDDYDDFYYDNDVYDDDGSGLYTESGDGESDLEDENKISFDDFTLRKLEKRVKRHSADGDDHDDDFYYDNDDDDGSGLITYQSGDGENDLVGENKIPYDYTFRKAKKRVKRHPADGDGHDDFYYDDDDYDGDYNGSGLVTESGDGENDLEGENKIPYDYSFRKAKKRVKRHPADGDDYDDDFYYDNDEYDDGDDDGSGLITESGDGQNDFESENEISFNDFTLRKVKKRVKRHLADGDSNDFYYDYKNEYDYSENEYDDVDDGLITYQSGDGENDDSETESEIESNDFTFRKVVRREVKRNSDDEDGYNDFFSNFYYDIFESEKGNGNEEYDDGSGQSHQSGDGIDNDNDLGNDDEDFSF